MANRTAKKDLPPMKLADYLCFSLYSASLAFSRVYRPLLAEFEITYTQWITLVALAEADGIGVNELGAKLHLESNTLTPMLKKLESKGFLTRDRSQADERQVIVRLTAAGRQVRNRGIEDQAAACTGLSARERRALQRSIVALRDNLTRKA